MIDRQPQIVAATHPGPYLVVRRSRVSAGIVLTLLLPTWSIVAMSALASDARHADAVDVFRCTFAEDWDLNYDRWPDRWVRKSGNDYPHYVNIQIQDDATAVGKKCLTIELDGASAAVSSPPIRVISRFRYAFEAQLKNEGLAHSQVLLTLDFFDKSGHLLQTKKSTALATTNGWQQVRIDAIDPSDLAIDHVVIGLEVVRGAKGDLNGRVSLADVRLARLPRIAVSTNNPSNVYSGLSDVVVRCELSGIRERYPKIHFQLLDEVGKVRDSFEIPLDGQLIVDAVASTSAAVDGVGQAPAGYEGRSEWRPKVPGYGIYRVVVKMLSSESTEHAKLDRELDNRTVWLAVVPPLTMPKQGEFGWSLPHGDRPLSFQALSQLLPQVGINWVKVPAWFDANDPRQGDELIRFVELLGASNIEVVGVIDRPPDGAELANRLGRSVPIAELLALDTATWSPALEPVMTRLSLRVRWWQLGRDDDASFNGFPAVNKRIDELRTQLFRFGQDVRLGMSWNSAAAKPEVGQVTWNFEQLVGEAPTTESEFNNLLASPHGNSAERWISIAPAPRIDDPGQSIEAELTARSSEFVRRLVAAKVHGAERIIVTNPFSDEYGLMQANGMPAELLLPWRTTAAMLGGAKYLGQMQLPAGSENRIFLRPDGQVVLVVWNAVPTQEVLFLGHDVQHIDLCGRSSKLTQIENEQVVEVGPRPTFVLGLHEAITRWRMAVKFEHEQVPSVFSKAHPNSLRFQNFFPQGVGGSLRIVVPQALGADEQLNKEENTSEQTSFLRDRWSIEPPKMNFQLAAGEQTDFPFEIRLKDAFYGKQPVHIEFQVEADQPYSFTVYRQMEVGTEDLVLKVQSQLGEDDTLIVEQLMTNRSSTLADFRCCLYVKGRRPQRAQVYRLSENLDRKLYRYPNGHELIGHEMLLEVEERNGPRVLKYRFVAAEASDEAENEHDEVAEDGDEVRHLETAEPADRQLGSDPDANTDAG